MTREVDTAARQAMVAEQIAARGVRDDRLLEAMRSVPRERFVAPEMVEFAYEDTALPIEAEQTISQPYIVALMLEALELRPDDRALEVGAGSGYAAAILSRLVARAFTIERHRSLAEAAERTLRELGYDNVEVLHGNGALGWDDEAPFDAILVSAGGSNVPPALLEQLAPGGRLVMPVGPNWRVQELKVYRKRADGTLSAHGLGKARFVPLIGTVAEAVGDDEAEATTRDEPGREVDLLRRHALPFESARAAAVDAAAERMAGHRTVLLGEGSHGTSEFYVLRERITRRLIELGAISFVAVEADWPDASQLDRYVRGIDEGAAASAAPFQRFPTWMWANGETLDFLRWLRDFNQTIDEPRDRVGFFGLDLYSLHASIQAIVDYLEDIDPDSARLARDRFACLTPWEGDPQTYGRLVTDGRLRECEDDVVQILVDLLARRSELEPRGGLEYMTALQNARLVANAERYYRVMYRSPTASWNLRDRHMFDTLADLLDYHGPDARAAVWAHNSHLGDASATDMGARGKLNVGQLCRERFGVSSYSVGMATHAGTVLAASGWGEPGRVMDVRASLPGSYERLSHDVETPAFFLPLRAPDPLRRSLAVERLERAIGVVYRPDTERASHYFHAALPRQFDEWIFIDRTEALSPLEPLEDELDDRTLDTYPFAV